MSTEVVCADVLEWAKNHTGPLFHAILCDPPYGLGKEPDMVALLTHWLAGDTYKTTGGGFMGKAWDVVPGPKVWQALRLRCHPGAYLFAFGGTRTADLLSIAIRLGGWERFDALDSISWCHGQGFNKVGNHPLKQAGEAFSGYGLSLKPMHEPVLCFRNLRVGTYAENCKKTGAGALNIDGTRIDVNTNDWKGKGGGGIHDGLVGLEMGNYIYQEFKSRTGIDHTKGRHPSNLLLTHTPDCHRRTSKEPCPECIGDECLTCGGSREVVVEGTKRIKPDGGRGTKRSGKKMGYSGGLMHSSTDPNPTDPDGYETVADWDCVPGCPVDAIAKQSGKLTSGQIKPTHQRTTNKTKNTYGQRAAPPESTQASQGTAARFYHQSDWSYEIEEQLAQADPMRYQAKASRSERDTGLEEFPDEERLIDTGNDRLNHKCQKCNKSRGSGSPCKCSNPEFQEVARLSHKNIHPTVKPIMLLKYLATLLLPPKMYAPRRILNVFSGSGSEMIGALLAGWDEIVGIDIDPNYCAITESRIKFWAGWSKSTGQTDVKKILGIVKKKPEKVVGQTELALIFH